MKLLWVVVVLVVLLIGGLTGYAYFGDMQADPRETRLPVELDLGPAPTAGTAPAAIAPVTETAPAADAAQETDAATTEQNDLD